MPQHSVQPKGDFMLSHQHHMAGARGLGVLLPGSSLLPTSLGGHHLQVRISSGLQARFLLLYLGLNELVSTLSC